MRKIRFYYDIVCPYSYMESRAVEAAEDAGDVEVEWLPFELRPAPKALLVAESDVARAREKSIVPAPGEYEMHLFGHRRPGLYSSLVEETQSVTT